MTLSVAANPLPPCLFISLPPSHFRSSCPPLLVKYRQRSQYWIALASTSNDDTQDRNNLNADNSASQPFKNTSNTSNSTGTSKNVNPWTLMGRVITEDQIRPLMNQESIQQGIIRSAAAQASGLELEEFETRLESLLTVMPFLQARLVRMKPALLAALAADVEKTATRIVQLQNILSGGNMESILSQRPSLVLDEEWVKIPAALESLKKHYNDEHIAQMASKEPILLIENVDTILKDLER